MKRRTYNNMLKATKMIAKKGDKIVTYFIYNPFTNAEDDVMNRMDFIIDDNTI